MPVSLTRNSTACRSPVAPSTRTASPTEPCPVNFSALPSRLTSTWRRRDGSPCSEVASAGSMSQVSSSPCFRAAARNERRMFSSSARGSKGVGSSLMAPASRPDMSMMSLMTVSSARPDSRAMSSSSRGSSSRGEPSASSVMPSTPLSGVRISCDMFARNWLLARLAASAASSACTRSVSTFSLRSISCSSSRWRLARSRACAASASRCASSACERICPRHTSADSTSIMTANTASPHTSTRGSVASAPDTGLTRVTVRGKCGVSAVLSRRGWSPPSSRTLPGGGGEASAAWTSDWPSQFRHNRVSVDREAPCTCTSSAVAGTNASSQPSWRSRTRHSAARRI